jgi:hypothetical protein
VHPEIQAPVFDELVDLLKRILVQQQIDALTRGELAFRFLAGETFFAAAKLSRPIQFDEPLQSILRGEFRHLAT